MNRKIIGYRSMLGMTQNEMAKQLGVSENTYRKKEHGKVPFKDFEMEKFQEVIVERTGINVSISDIFFDDKLQKLQV